MKTLSKNLPDVKSNCYAIGSMRIYEILHKNLYNYTSLLKSNIT